MLNISLQLANQLKSIAILAMFSLHYCVGKIIDNIYY